MKPPTYETVPLRHFRVLVDCGRWIAAWLCFVCNPFLSNIMQKKITLARTLVESQIMGLPPLETFTLTEAGLRAFNSGKGHPLPSADRWLRGLREGKPVTWNDVASALE